jgi:hypothetical protein
VASAVVLEGIRCEVSPSGQRIVTSEVPEPGGLYAPDVSYF